MKRSLPRLFPITAGALLTLFSATLAARADVDPQAHYNLQGMGGIRDTAAPPVWKSRGNGPDLARQGSPKIMSNGPDSRRALYDSSVKFEQPDQCYSVGKNLIDGDNFVLEAWAYASKADDGGFHTIVANGTGRHGFLLAQDGQHWSVLVGGVRSVELAKIKPGVWTHLAVVKADGRATGWVDGLKAANLPDLGGGDANFSIGATAPNKEAFAGWVAEVRYATFKPGKFDPSADFLIDGGKLKVIQAEERATRARLIQDLAKTPGAAVVKQLDERPAPHDWLLAPPATRAVVQVAPAPDNQSATIMLANGLVSRSFTVRDGNLACISLRRSDRNIEFVRAMKPEVRVCLDDHWVNVGGLQGAPDHAFITPAWLDSLESAEDSFHFTGMTVGGCVKPYEWQPKCNAPADIAWPAKGVRVTFHFAAPAEEAKYAGIGVDVSYELYEGLPVMMKTFTLRNDGQREVVVTRFEGEHLAVQPTNSTMLRAESDYAFALGNFRDTSSGLGIHADGDRSKYQAYYLGGGTTRLIRDPDWGSMATLNSAEDIYLGDIENALLLSLPPTGPNWPVKAGETFDAFRTFEILHDSTDRERQSLAQRRFYRKLAPQTNEKMFEVHAPVTQDMAALAPLMDQMEEIGFTQLQAPEHPGGFNYADPSEKNVRPMKAICDYAKTKGIRVGAYQLMMASQGWGSPEDHFNCIDPVTGKPGSAFGQSACGASAWADMYYENMWKTIEATGMGAFKPDGPYHGDPCAATDHPHHRGLEDSQWAQWKWMCKVLHEGQRRNLYLTVPDWYFLNGQACTGMGYREATDGIDIVLQTIIYRQYIFDATWQKTAQMGWVNLNTEVLHGGMEKNLDKYERSFFTLLSSGGQVWLRGLRLYDGPESRAMLKKWMAWYHKYEDLILGDIIHLRRPDGRGLDYYLHVDPKSRKGMLLVFNPLDAPVKQDITVPLYYTGLTDTARIREQESAPRTYTLDREFQVTVPVEMKPNGYTWLVIE